MRVCSLFTSIFSAANKPPFQSDIFYRLYFEVKTSLGEHYLWGKVEEEIF